MQRLYLRALAVAVALHGAGFVVAWAERASAVEASW